MTTTPLHLSQVVLEIEQHVARGGWDQPARLYALVETAGLVRHEPALAERLGIPATVAPGELTPIEQEALPADRPLGELLAGIAWPPKVLGCALVVERLMLPPDVEAELADRDPADLIRKVADHPRRQEVRIAVGVLRDGSRQTTIRLRSHDSDDMVLTGPELVPNLAEALAMTLED
ncbi:hypothetical protein TH66_09885 [Carbonactinospora thermoautotrophica]|uniref:Uncharacterized protein n=1 Tax=Carbonactinospora thermoautotrophica TaxID=1469144 RepID=A0A132MNP7_9ACTN|nr:PPA1309 family protein [Carbonactinospora thermoautotrophica]KWW99355.1 Uncharacterized protein LI90_989 [Carbonactinospora thermoautotrophica]KWX04185.1 hypothetical protein TH66_09885 [Carbonactinospora thermoautotrophica]KWX08381.1 hypothetical protein TR74_15250 [Carbonactinospora thermoautotrophica]